MGMGFAPTWLRQVSPLLHKTTLTTGARACRRSQTLGTLWSAPWDGGVAEPLETRSSLTCYHTKFRRSTSSRRLSSSLRPISGQCTSATCWSNSLTTRTVRYNTGGQLRH